MTVLLDVLNLFVRNWVLTTARNLWRCIARFVTLQFIRHESTQRYIGIRRQWCEPSNLHKYTHGIIEAFACILNNEYLEWRKATENRNAELVRQNGYAPRWERYSQTKIENCLVNPSFKQYLALKWDDYLAQVLAIQASII